MALKSLGAFVVLFGAVSMSLADCTRHADLNNYERGQLILVAYGTRTDVFAQFLSEAGCGEQMLNGLSHLGAQIDFADKKAGYALVTIPREKLLDTLDIDGIAYADTRDSWRWYYRDQDAKIPQSERRAEPVPAITIPHPRVASAVSKDGPYFATGEIGLTELWKRHPEADGRGVVVAVPDEGVDLLHPALQQGRDSAGKIVPKIVDLGTLASPNEDSGWVRLVGPMQTKNGDFAAAGRTWTAPEDGTYRFGIFKTELVLGPEGNSKTKKLPLAVGVLWNENRNRIWVDTDGDGSFRDQRALGDYGSAHDIDWFGKQEGEDDNRIPFGVKIDAERNAVYVGIGANHGAFIAGALAGNRLTGGLFDGAAPSAQLIDFNFFGETMIAAVVKMFARPDVDVVNRSGAIAATYVGRRQGAGDFERRVLERLIAVYNKPIACFCSAAGALFVQDYASPEMLRRNRQLEPPYLDTINTWLPFLPDGLVNTILAPSTNLETDSRYEPQDLTWPDGKRHSFSDDKFNPPAPDGYVIGSNNSPAIAVVSGVLADLISEAKQEHVRYNSVRLNNAIFTGTQLLDGFLVSRQGYGLINASQSWAQLASMAKADDPANPELTSFTASRMDAGHTVDVEGFQADLPTTGERLNGEIWITRHGGYAGGRKYTFSLRGNDGSFTLLDHKAILLRSKPTRVRFATNGASGWHIAFLELRDRQADVVMEEVPLSVRVPDVPEKIALGVDRYLSTIPPLRSQDRYVSVDEQAQATRYVIRIPYTGPCCSTRWFPGSSYRTNKTPPGEPIDPVHHVGPMETLESLVMNDDPGTQDIFWENRGRPEYATQYDGPAPDVPIHAELTVTKYAVAMEEGADETLTITNKLANIQGRVEFYTAALRSTQLTGTGLHASREMERILPDDLVQWRLRLTADTAGAEPADAYVLNCAGKAGCYVAAQQQISHSSKTLVIDKPQGGNWKIVVCSRGQVLNPVMYTLQEAPLVHAPSPAEQADIEHPSGTAWTVSLPRKQTDARYAAMRIAGTPGDKWQKDGLLIDVTPIDSDAP